MINVFIPIEFESILVGGLIFADFFFDIFEIFFAKKFRSKKKNNNDHFIVDSNHFIRTEISVLCDILF